MASITGAVITFNEEDHIGACISSLMRVCNEIVVVDSQSSDRTREIAERGGARIVSQQYLGEGFQRGLTEQHARNDWILALDADERLDDELCHTIKTLALDDPGTAYAFNRKSYVGNHWIRGPGFYPDFVTRLYNRSRAGYEQRPGHANVEAPAVRRLPGHILHYTYDDLADWIAKINWLTSRDAQGMFDAGRAASRWKPFTSAVAAAFRQLVLRGGAVRGIDGWTIALTSVFRAYMKYLKLNELHQRQTRTASLASVARQRDSDANA